MNPADRLPQDHDQAPPTRAEVWRSNIVLSAVILLLLALFVRNASAPREQVRAADGQWIPLDTRSAPAPAWPYDDSDCFKGAGVRSKPLDQLTQQHNYWMESEARASRRLQGEAWTLEWYPVTQGEIVIIKPVYRFSQGGQ